MAKGGRKKREKRKDFQKVKLKVGKKKPQAENFTVTTFKSQAIHIREQLKSGKADDAEPTTQRKKNIHDLLCHLNHYNASIRQSTIVGMKELLSGHPSLITQHLPILIDSLVVLITDKEDTVRKSGISLLQLVLQATPSDRIAPFFPILSAHLSCAMTHIMEDIQLDSLAILDLVLQFYPRLLTAHSQELLTIFIQQISQQRKKTVSWTESEADDMELAVRPGSKISSHKWRQKVLLRLRQFLTALLEEHCTKHSLQAETRRERNKENQENLENYTVIVGGEEETYVPIFAPGAQVHGHKEGFVLGALSSSSSSSTSSTDFTKPETLLGFVRSLVPLLLQCWMEVAPKSQEQSQTHLHAVAMEILDGVLSVIQLLWRWMASVCEDKQEFSCMTQLQKLYHKKFISHLLSCFPYTSHNAPIRAKHSGKGVPSVSVVNLNLAACEIMSYFMTRSDMESNWLRKIMAYVLETSVEGSDLSTENMQSLLSVVRRLVKVLPSRESVSDLLQAVLSLYESCHLLSRNKCETLICLDELSSCGENTHPSSRAVDSLLLQTLPKLLMELGCQRMETSQHALQILLRRAAQQHPVALQCIQGSIKSFVDPDEGILIHLSSDLQVSVINLIHHADPLDLATLRSLAMCCHDNRMSSKNVTYLINVMSSRLLDVGISVRTERKLPFNLSDFISFLFSVSIGCSQSELERLHKSRCQGNQATNRPLPSCLTPTAVPAHADSALQHHHAIVKSVCLSYNLISSKQQVWCIVQEAISNLLNNHKTLPLHTVYAVLYTTNYLTTPETFWRLEVANKLMECCLATLYMAVSDDEAAARSVDGWREALWNEAVSLLVRSRPLLVALMERIKTGVADLTDMEPIRGVAMVLIRLLQTQLMSPALAEMTDCVRQAVHSVLTHRLATEDSRWVAELRYEASLILKPLS